MTVKFIIFTGIYYGRLTALLPMTFLDTLNEIQAPANLLINIINHKNSLAVKRRHKYHPPQRREHLHRRTFNT